MIRTAALAHHLIRIAVPLLVLALVPVAAPVAGLALYLGLFLFVHELAHGAFGLPRRHNERALAIVGIAMMTSGHGLRRMHLRHHADPLGADDLESAAGHLTWWRALAAAPGLCVQLIAAGWRTATAADRRWQRLEYAVIAAALCTMLALGARAPLVFAAEALAMQALAPVWAGRLPHYPPAWLLAVAHPLARGGSMAMKALVEHDAHHRRPKLPMDALQLGL